MISWMQSLSDLTRTRLLRILDQAELTVVELCTVLQLPQSTVSRHLKMLSEDGWLISRRDGTSNLYALENLEDTRSRLWDLVKEQTSGDLVSRQDDTRLEQVLLERSNRSQSFFSSAASKWDHLRNELFGSRLDAWTFSALLPSDWVVADLGCGTGPLVQMLAPHVKEVYGIDSSAEMLKAAKERVSKFKNVILKKADLYRLPIENSCVDAVLLSIVLPYLEQPKIAFAEAARITKPNGRLVLIDLLPHDRVEYRQELNHAWFGFSTDEVAGMLNESGWSVERSIHLPPQMEAKGPNLFLCVAKRV